MSRLRSTYQKPLTRPRRFAYSERYPPSYAYSPCEDEEGVCYETFFGDSDTDSMSYYQPVNPNAADVYNLYSRSAVAAQRKVKGTYVAPVRTATSYYRPSVPPVAPPNSFQSKYLEVDKNVYCSYQNPLYKVDSKNRQRTYGYQKVAVQVDAKDKSKANMFGLKKKKSALPTFTTSRYVRAGRRNSVLSIPLTTKLEPIRSRPVYTQTSPKLDYPYKHCRSEGTALVYPDAQGKLRGTTRRLSGSRVRSPRLEQFTFDAAGEHEHPRKEKISTTLNNTQIDIEKYERRFVQNHTKVPSNATTSKENSLKSSPTIKASETAQSSSGQENGNPQQVEQKKSAEQFGDMLDHLLNDLNDTGLPVNGLENDNIKEMFEKMKSATDQVDSTRRSKPKSAAQTPCTSYNQYLNMDEMMSQVQNYDTRGREALANEMEEAKMKVPSIAELELHRSKTLVTNLIDRELNMASKANYSSYSFQPSSTVLQLDARDAISYVQNSNNSKKEMELTEAVTDTLIGTSYPKPHQVGAKNEMRYLKWLKKIRKDHLKNIQRELKQLEELDETIDPINSS